jgi:hypothetical protein
MRVSLDVCATSSKRIAANWEDVVPAPSLNFLPDIPCIRVHTGPLMLIAVIEACYRWHLGRRGSADPVAGILVDGHNEDWLRWLFPLRSQVSVS